MTRQNNHRRYTCLKVHAWPEKDRVAWLSATSSGDILEDGGRGAHWADGTRRKYAESYGIWLGFLEKQERLDPAVGPADRVQPEWVRRYLSDLEVDCAPRKIVMRIEELLVVLSAMRLDRDWGWLRVLVGNLRAKYPNQGLRPTPLLSAREVYAWGCREMRIADASTDLRPRRRAGRYRDGLMLALLIARPVRRRNFVSIEIGKHLILETDAFFLVFEAAETKTKRPLEYPVPSKLVGPLANYMEQYRPVLLNGSSSTRLWITERGKPYTARGFSEKVWQVTRRAFGQPMRPHVFRHIAATSIATEDPEHARIIAEILGHTTLGTADKHYNRARQIDAGCLYQKSLLNLRKHLERRKFGAPPKSADRI
jgi:integrase